MLRLMFAFICLKIGRKLLREASEETMCVRDWQRLSRMVIINNHELFE